MVGHTPLSRPSKRSLTCFPAIPSTMQINESVPFFPAYFQHILNFNTKQMVAIGQGKLSCFVNDEGYKIGAGRRTKALLLIYGF